jgi:hypothetical protein
MLLAPASESISLKNISGICSCKVGVECCALARLGGSVKLTLTALALVFFSCLLAMSQSPRAVPAHLRHAQELQAQNERIPAGPVHSTVDAEGLRIEADQLAKLAASVPTDIQNVNQGLLSKDLAQKLKQIEKLSKHLRTELNH